LANGRKCCVSCRSGSSWSTTAGLTARLFPRPTFLLNAATTVWLAPERSKKPPSERRLCEGRTVAGNPTPWHVEIARDEFKLFGDCTSDDLEAGDGLDRGPRRGARVTRRA
jgi:hypothetical protein